MLGLLFKGKRREKSLEEKVECIQKGDENLQNTLIESYKPFIAKTVSSVCRRYIHESDDEFSIGLIAFNEAIQKYSSEKGTSLISFSEVIIKRRVIDYIRQQAKHQGISLDYHDDFQEEQASGLIDAELSIKEYKDHQDQIMRREEILQLTTTLGEFDLSFKELIEHSPKHTDARKNAMFIAKIIAENDHLKQYLLDTRRLPIKELLPLVSVSRKTIERNRKYIIAITLIIAGDYVFLKDYLKGGGET
ncbi:RNA polymerase sigma factor [Cytobacillus purgationiresistens]|uniref:RNA polymerase sigma factor SigI n=2 Tax=Cytobacillus purgationiresistens TaxID=863449 RepID=A0ABU0AHU9_9BACI|nr:RNA polymerase sigma factor [Cytobacillus purgationiresistens]